jgi:hypothetical protein
MIKLGKVSVETRGGKTSIVAEATSEPQVRL